MSFVTESSLLIDLQKHNLERSWSYFYDKYAPLISGFARKRGVPQEDVCDILQETMLELYAALPRFQYDPQKGKFRNFVLLITSRKCARYFEKQRQLPTSTDPVDLEWMRQLDVGNATDQATSASELEFLSELIAMVLENLRKKKRISDSTYHAYKLYALKNDAAPVIAKKLGMSKGQLYRIKNRINKMIQQEIQSGDYQDCEMVEGFFSQSN